MNFIYVIRVLYCNHLITHSSSNRSNRNNSGNKDNKRVARFARARFEVSMSVAVFVQLFEGNQVVPVWQVDDIDEVHQLDPVHQVDHKDEYSIIVFL